MTLLITVIAAVISTTVWYTSENARRKNVSLLCFMYWGASLMWLVDAAVEYMEMGAEYFTPQLTDMINDSFLGLSVTVFGTVIWVISLLVKDPDDVIKSILTKKT